METLTLAPCGVVCELCSAFQRTRNRCVGCNSVGYKPKHCTVCTIKLCTEKSDPEDLCLECEKYPCRRLKDLGKRYKTKYGEDLTANMRLALGEGYARFTEEILNTWKCPACGGLFSAHRAACAGCSAPNPNFPGDEK